jgi:hypothetical protein
MPDITGFRVPCGRESAAIPLRTLSRGAADLAVHGDDDELLRLLVTSWTLITGRTLRADVPPERLSEDELIGFWADDHLTTEAV